MSTARTTTALEHVDLLIVGAGISGIGAAYHLQNEPSRQDVRDPRGARCDRRHLGPVPLPGDPLGLRPAHVRLRVQALAAGQGDRRRRGDPRLPARDRQRERDRRATSASTTRCSAPPGRPTRPAGSSTSSAPTPASAVRSAAAGCSGPAATTTTTRASPRSSRAPTEFEGQIVHPQAWPEDLDYAGKRVVVIGSGATAVTLIPALAETAGHVTMLQRSPSYILSVPEKDAIANALRRGAQQGARLSDHAPQEHPAAAGDLRCLQALPAAHAPADPARDRQAAPGGLSGRHALQPELRPVGPAAVRRPGRRPVQGDQQRQRLGRDRPDRDLHRERPAAGVRPRARGRHRRHRHRPEHARARRHPADRRRPPGRPVQRPPSFGT